MVRKRLFENPWWVVFGSTVGLIVSNGPVMFFTFGVLLNAVTKDLGGNRATLAFAMIVAELGNGVGSPVVGTLIDRWGIRPVLLSSIVLFSGSAIALSQVPASPVAFILLYGLFGATSAGASPIPYAKAISAWFDARRGLALGIATAGVGLGTAFMPQLTRVLIDRFDWRGAYAGLGIFTLVVSLVAVAPFVREPKMPLDSYAGGPAAVLPGVSLGEAMKDSATFWALMLVVFLSSGPLNGTIGDMVPMLGDRGVPRQIATSLVTVSGLALIPGRFLCGYLLDRFFGPYVAAGFFLVSMGGIVAVSSVSAGALLWLGAVLLGLGLGADIALLAFLAGRYFGLRSLGVIYGFAMGIFVFAAGIGQWLMSLSFEMTHSYSWALGGFAVALLFASILVARLGPYNYAGERAASRREAEAGVPS